MIGVTLLVYTCLCLYARNWACVCIQWYDYLVFIIYFRLKDKARKMKKHVKPAAGLAVGGTAEVPGMILPQAAMILVSRCPNVIFVFKPF